MTTRRDAAGTPMTTGPDATAAHLQPDPTRRPPCTSPALEIRDLRNLARIAPPPTVRIGGLALGRLDTRQVVDRVFSAFELGLGGWLVTASIDFMRRARAHSESLVSCGEADLVIADGAPLVWAASLMDAPLPESVPGSELVWRLSERAAVEERSLYLLGGSEDSTQRATRALLSRCPGLRIVGCSSPQLSPEPTHAELEDVLSELQRLVPDLVCVALESPAQERLIRALRGHLPRAWWLSGGLGPDFVAGGVAGLKSPYPAASKTGGGRDLRLLRNLPFTLCLLYEALHA